MPHLQVHPLLPGLGGLPLLLTSCIPVYSRPPTFPLISFLSSPHSKKHIRACLVMLHLQVHWLLPGLIGLPLLLTSCINVPVYGRPATDPLTFCNHHIQTLMFFSSCCICRCTLCCLA
jgi:hypothetical protein